MHLFLKQLQLCLVLILIIYPIRLKAIDHTDARSSSLASATVSCSELGNPASLSAYEYSFAQLNYENSYFISDLSTYSFNALLVNKFVDVALITSRFGNEFFNETLFSLNLSKRLFDNLLLGVRVNYSLLNQSLENGADGSLLAGIGILYKISDKFNAAISTSNIVNVAVHGIDSQVLPWVIRIGGSYTPNNSFKAFLEVEKVKMLPLIYKIAAEYFLIEDLPLRLGFIGAPFRPTFGAGYSWSQIRVDAAVLYHLSLGIQPGLSLTYTF
ncbi:MAG: hypothetical protein ACRCZM_04545 [Bacteroidales bacterium]